MTASKIEQARIVANRKFINSINATFVEIDKIIEKNAKQLTIELNILYKEEDDK